MIAGVIGGGENVEDGSQDGKREARPVAWGGLYGSGEVLADFGEEFVEVWRLAN